MTVALVDPDAAARCALPYTGEIERAGRHRAEGEDDVCVECGWHWPCPSYFQARHALIQAGVSPAAWAGRWPQTWRTRWRQPS